jgi:acetoin utilization protein AcuC
VGCKVGVSEGQELLLYAFPSPHPFTGDRAKAFWEELSRRNPPRTTLQPQKAGIELLRLFHTDEHIRFVELASRMGYGSLDEGDTPAYKGVFEAAQWAVGSTLSGVEGVLDGNIDHAFNPVGGLHHSTREKSAGFCVFNDIGVSVELLRSKGFGRILYVDIDVHHGDGVYYPYESDPDIFIFDVHQDGRYLYPGTGSASETGLGKAEGTKVNIPLLPGSGDADIIASLPKLEALAMRCKPEFIIFQCGADGLAGDPISGLNYTPNAHLEVATLMHRLSHLYCEGRMVALGGGGYVPKNCADAWNEVVASLAT